MQLLGDEQKAFGYGRSLLHSDDTLMQHLGHQGLNQFLQNEHPFLASLWSPPQLFAGIRMEPTSGRLQLGDRFVSYPALFLLDHRYRVQRVMHTADDGGPLIAQLHKLGTKQPFVWVDRCSHISRLQPTDEAPACLLAGRLELENLHSTALHGDPMTWPTLRSMIEPAPATSEEALQQRIERLKRWALYGTEHVHNHTGPATFTGSFIVRSSGGLDTAPSTAWLVGADPTESPLEFARGITLLGLNADAPPVMIGHIDTCAPTPEDRVHGGPYLEAPLQQVMQELHSAYRAFIVLAHDSARCTENSVLHDLFQGTKFQQWTQIGFRQPYVGIVSEDGTHHDYLGDPNTSIAVHIRGIFRPSSASES